MENKKIRIGITQGDANGIGYELILETFADAELLELCTPIVYGSPKLATYHRNMLNLETPFSVINDAAEAKEERLNLLTVFEEEVKVEVGIPTKEAGITARKAMDKALDDYKAGLIDVLLNAPFNKATFFSDNEQHESIATYIAQRLETDKKPVQLFVNKDLRVATVTGETALKNVTAQITKEKIEKQAELIADYMKCDFLLSKARIALLALNPAKGNEQPEKEEQEIIIPTVKNLITKGIQAFGPYQADTFFGNNAYETFDVVLAMYYDQGITPFKTLAVEDGTQLIMGLPLVVTASVDEVSYEKAGKGIANETAFRQALYLAIDTYRNRAFYNQAHENPLEKLYHDKRDDSEKARYTVSKKGENEDKRKPSEVKHE